MDKAERDLDKIRWSVIKQHVESVEPIQNAARPWWNTAYGRAFERKQQLFKLKSNSADSLEKYQKAKHYARNAQRRAIEKYNIKIKKKLASIDNSDASFLQITKEIAGVDQSFTSVAPSPDELVTHFAKKMSNGKGDDADAYSSSSPKEVLIHSWKIRYKSVLKALRSMDPAKSVNGISPVFWKECATSVQL